MPHSQSHLLVVALLATALVACSKSEAPTTQTDVPSELLIKIGASAPLTGPQAHIGKDNENGTRMAIEDANARGVTIAGRKVHFELLSEDDQTDPKTATIVA